VVLLAGEFVRVHNYGVLGQAEERGCGCAKKTNTLLV